jgi:hypothetical protein
MASNMRSWDWAGAQVQAGATLVTVVGWALVGPLYLLFTAHALQGGVASWLRSRPGHLVIGLLAVLLLTLAFLPASALVGLGRTVAEDILFVTPLIATGLVGLIAAVQNLRRASDARHRRQARAYLLAFAVRDVAYVAFYLFYALARETLYWGEPGSPSNLLYVWLIGLQLMWLAFLVLLVYGVLSGQVLDLDRRTRVVAARTLALGLVAALFIVITESVERFLNVSDPSVGIGAAVVLAFTFRPVEHLAERGARRILPASPVSVDDYKRAVEHALADGQVTPSEQRVLDDLKARLS